MLKLRQLADWLSELPKSAPIPFEPTPDIPEYGHGDYIGTVNRLSGSGLIREGTFEVQQVQVLLRGAARDYDVLETTTGELDQALHGISNEMLWGTYVTYAQRQGGWQTSTEDDGERVSFIATYEIENGL